MTSADPPKAARWLMTHFGCSPNNAAVIGDLDERYRHQPSVIWYWRQVCLAIVAALLETIREHKLLAIRGLMAGWIMLQALVWVARPPFLQLQDWTFRFWGESLFTHAPLFLVEATIALMIGSAIGALLSRWHRPYARTVVLLFVATHSAWICGGLAAWHLIHGYATFRGALPYTVRIIGWECVFLSAVIWAGVLVAPYQADSQKPAAIV
jgi:hypothetical protein